MRTFYHRGWWSLSNFRCELWYELSKSFHIIYWIQYLRSSTYNICYMLTIISQDEPPSVCWYFQNVTIKCYHKSSNVTALRATELSTSDTTIQFFWVAHLLLLLAKNTFLAFFYWYIKRQTFWPFSIFVDLL